MSTPPVLVDVDGRTASWSPSQGFTGDPDIVAAAELAVDIHLSVDVGEALIEADVSTPLGATGALCAHRPGRTRVLACPDEVSRALSGLEDEAEEDGVLLSFEQDPITDL